MKSFFTSLLLLCVTVIIAQKPVTDYSYKFKITNLSDSTDSVVYMANYYGKKQYYFDTATINNDGSFEFSGDTIVGGIYSIILSDKKSFFEFVVNEPKVEMSTTSGNFVKSMKVAESIENEKFYQYLNFIESKSGSAQNIKVRLESAKGKDKEKLQEQLAGIDKEVIDFKKSFIEANPNLFVSTVFQASAEPDVPDYKEIKDDDERQKKRYLDFKSQYLQNIDFTDERLLRTPVFHNKLSYYMTKLVPQVPDSIIKEADILVAKTDGNKEMYKYVVHFITSHFEDSKIMGMDAVLVHMGQNYYCADKAWWLSKKKLEEFCERVDKMAPILIGKQAPNLILKDTADQWRDLYKISAPYTILYFWDSGCGHCKKVTPKLKELYEQYKDKGVAIYAVGTEFENKDWKKYIIKNELPFINVSDNPTINENAHELIRNGETTLQSLNFRDTYDIFSTPKVFLLDENKKIIATKLMPEQLGEFLDRKLNGAEGDSDSKKKSK